MRTYTVRVFIPTVYEIKARDPQEASRKAVERYKTEYKTRVEPEVEVDGERPA